MRFTYLTAAFLATLVSAQPATTMEEVPLDLTSGNVTGEAFAKDALSVEARSLVKRANVVFIVYDNPSCSNGGGAQITRDGTGAKGDFATQQWRVKIPELTNGWHLSLYTGRGQSGTITRFYAENVGANHCWYVENTSWLSYGLYSS